jgi:hypothetical protein
MASLGRTPRGSGIVAARLVACLSVAGTVLLGSALSAPAQETGKVQGLVIDAQTGEAIAGATVRVLGTTRHGISGDDGYYFINEVGAGLQTIVAEFIGRRAFRIENQRVLAGQTMTLNFELEVAAIELEPLVVEGERNPLVPRDQVSSKAIVTGELIDALPMDNATSIVVLQPGVIDTDEGRTIRGSRPNEEAVYVDGVITRRYLTGEVEPIELPTNALAEVDVTTGGIGAEYMDAGSGLVNYVTRSGGSTLGGSLVLFTDQSAPKEWRTGFNRLEFTFGGPILREQNLSFFLAGAAEGRKYQGLNDGWLDVPLLLNDGVDVFDATSAAAFGRQVGDPAVFSLPRSSNAVSGTDSLRVAFPNFTAWDNGPTLPYNPSDEYTFLGRLDWGIAGGASVNISYKRAREQSIDLALENVYNPDGYTGVLETADVLTLGGYFLLTQTAFSALALDVKASYQKYFDQLGLIEPDWLREHRDPTLGFNFSNIKFLFDHDDYPVSKELMYGARSNAIPGDSMQAYPARFDLAGGQSLPGLVQNLRFNPYGMRFNWPISGYSNTALGFTVERNWVFSGALDWQAGRYIRLRAGGDLALLHVEDNWLLTYASRAAPAVHDPKRGGLWATGRLDLGDMVIDAGVRWDYFDPNGEFPRVPGYVFNVPDSLKADFWQLLPPGAIDRYTGEPFPAGTALVDRLRPLEDCGGAETEADRLNPETGQPVCKPNFLPGRTKSEWSPRLGVSFPVTVKSTFRLSYSHNVQTPPLGTSDLGVVAGQFGYFRNIYDDLAGGRANTFTPFGRDLDMARTVTFEVGYRQLIGEDLVVDLAAYSKTARNAVTIRKVLWENPNNPSNELFISSAVNADYTHIIGVDLTLDKRFGQFADLSTSYSYVDARGTGSDPFTAGAWIYRHTNLSALTNLPPDPPDVMLRLDQSRTHNFAGTFALLFPRDFRRGTALGSILSDFGAFVTFRVASGLPYTRERNSATGCIGPGCTPNYPAEEYNASNMPWEKRLDLRLTKGLPLRGTRVLLFVDWRNPFNLENTNRIFQETGTAYNDQFRRKQLNQQMTDPLLDGDTDVDGFSIMQESPDNDVNKFSLLQAERRYGDGDGYFSVEEQEKAFGAWYDLFWGVQNFVESTQRLRLGLEIRF